MTINDEAILTQLFQLIASELLISLAIKYDITRFDADLLVRTLTDLNVPEKDAAEMVKVFLDELNSQIAARR